MPDEHTGEQVSGVLKAPTGDVRPVVLTRKTECRRCVDVRLPAEEVAALSPRLALEAPALAVTGAPDCGIRFFGLTGGCGFTGVLPEKEFVRMVLHAGGGKA